MVVFAQLTISLIVRTNAGRELVLLSLAAVTYSIRAVRLHRIGALRVGPSPARCPPGGSYSGKWSSEQLVGLDMCCMILLCQPVYLSVQCVESSRRD
jgi:hypothetical protein